MYPDRIISIDFETLGTVPQYDSPVSVAAVVMEGGIPTGEVFSSKIMPSPRSKFSLEAFAVQSGSDAWDHEMLSEHLKRIMPQNAPSAGVVFSNLCAWCQSVGAKDIPNVAHGMAFDFGFYYYKLRQSSDRRPALSPVWICTIEMARDVLGESFSMSLANVCAALGVPFDVASAHDPMYDALKAGECYFAMREARRDR